MNAATATAPAHTLDCSAMSETSVEIARNIYRDCRERFDGTAAEFKAACVDFLTTKVSPSNGRGGLQWALAAMSLVGDLDTEHPEFGQLSLLMEGLLG